VHNNNSELLWCIFIKKTSNSVPAGGNEEGLKMAFKSRDSMINFLETVGQRVTVWHRQTPVHGQIDEGSLVCRDQLSTGDGDQECWTQTVSTDIHKRIEQTMAKNKTLKLVNIFLQLEN